MFFNAVILCEYPGPFSNKDDLMDSNKNTVYAALVKSRKSCHLCTDLKNPSEYNDGIFDSNQIGPWSKWQGNLNAKLMVIGQDWGDTNYYHEHQGSDSDDNPSNKTLQELLYSIGIKIPPPSSVDNEKNILFLTNAILCLKKGGMGGKVKQAWFDACGKQYLKPLIEIVHPKVIVSLGTYAYRSICKLYALPEMRFRDAVDKQAGFSLSNGMLFFAMYHCSRQVLNTHRSLDQQKADWERVIQVLEL